MITTTVSDRHPVIRLGRRLPAGALQGPLQRQRSGPRPKPGCNLNLRSSASAVVNITSLLRHYNTWRHCVIMSPLLSIITSAVSIITLLLPIITYYYLITYLRPRNLQMRAPCYIVRTCAADDMPSPNRIYTSKQGSMSCTICLVA